jgi:hypothetical protein
MESRLRCAGAFRVHSILIRTIAVTILAIPFLVLTSVYDNLPENFPLLRNWSQQPVLWANKSLLTVFRVPIIGTITAAAAEVMRCHTPADVSPADRKPLARLWLILLVTACMKSLFEGFDLAQTAEATNERLLPFGNAAFATVVVVLALATTQLRRAWPFLTQRSYWQLARTEQVALTSLGVIYIVIAFGPIFWGGRIPG